ncbi:hypothetical protein DRQ12_09075 [candidate division KSB1 bacterium]|nr:MAG: hypothetical protein DRQ12_09075 [candidate division KSB1 bacterium]
MAEILIFFQFTVYVNQEHSMQGNAYSSLKSLGPSQRGDSPSVMTQIARELENPTPFSFSDLICLGLVITLST